MNAYDRPAPQQARDDALAQEAKAEGERPDVDGHDAEPLPEPIRGIMALSAWFVGLGVAGAGVLLLFLVGWALKDGVEGGGAIGNMLLFMGLPVVVGIGIAAGRGLRRTQEQRLRASLDAPRLVAPDATRASTASESPVAVRPDRTS